MSTFKTPTTDSTFRLRDGRTFGYMEVGKIDGPPIFHCHGSGSSRLEVNLLAAAATAQGVRLIGLDRPGIGRSDPKAGYRLLDWHQAPSSGKPDQGGCVPCGGWERSFPGSCGPMFALFSA